MIPEDIITYQEFMAVCYENGVVREWEIKLRYEIHVAMMMEWEDKAEEKVQALQLNEYYFMIGKLN